MSKWINKDLFDHFRKEKIDEKDTQVTTFRRSDLLWDTPEKGTVEQPKIYEGRFLPDSNGNFYEKYFYHMWQAGEKWVFVLCPKTFDFANYCPFCSAVNKLYSSGSKQDRSHAYQLKRKEKFVSNFYIVKDPRDVDRDEENKVVGRVKLYEFPSKVETKLKNEVTDRDEGYGMEIFDPSENGRNFILKVLSTKKQEDGRTWPDYSSSQFSRTQNALGSEDEIEELMKNCIDIKEYIRSMETSEDKQIEILKNEFLWEILEEEALKNGYQEDKPKKSVKKEESKTDESEPDWNTGKEEKPKEEEKPKPKEEKSDEYSDDDLLAELDDM